MRPLSFYGQRVLIFIRPDPKTAVWYAAVSGQDLGKDEKNENL